MKNHSVFGLHHVTAIAGNAKRNYDFYTKTMGMRFIKKTVNFDDPSTYHLYYGNYKAEPGTAWTFFPNEGIPQGRRGTGQATEVGFSVPEGSLEFWVKHLDSQGIIYNKPAERFGIKYLSLIDPDGLKIELNEVNENRMGNPNETIGDEFALRGFSGVTLTVRDRKPTESILTELLDYELVDNNANRFWYKSKNIQTADRIEIVELPNEGRGHVSNGSVHHVAFRVKDDTNLLALRENIVSAGHEITPMIDRNYFHSLYFREPNGILFEIATDTPGFTVDEPLESLGVSLKLPSKYEKYRQQITENLQEL